MTELETKEKAIQDLLDNDALMNGLSSVETPDELGKLLEENHIQLTDGTPADALRELKEKRAAVEAGEVELSDDDLEDVSGGVAIAALAKASICFGVAAVGIGVVVVGGLWLFWKLTSKKTTNNNKK